MPTAKGFSRHGGGTASAYTKVDDELRVPSGSTFRVDDGATFTMNGAFSATAGETGKFIETGTYASAAENGIALSADNERPVSFLFDDAGTTIAGSANCRAVLSRVYISIAPTAGCTIVPIQGQLKIADNINYPAGRFCGVDGYLEFGGTTTIASGGYASAINARVDVAASETVTVASGGYLCGIHVHTTGSGTLTSTGNSYGILINDQGTVDDWKVGLSVNNSTTGVEVGAATTGVSLSGAVTTGISISGDATDGIKISGGTVTDAIEIGASTTGVNISGAVTTGLSIAGNATDGIKISGGTVVDAIEIGSATNGINFSGTYTNALNLNSATLTQNLNNALISIGDYDAQKEISMTASYIPLQINLASVANPGSGLTMGCAYLRADAATEDQTNAQIVPLMVRSTLYFDVDSAYAIQSHLKINTAMATGASHANIAAVSAKIDLDANVTQGNVQAGLFIMEGTGTITEEANIVQICNENGTTVDSSLAITGSGTSTNAIAIASAYTTNFVNFSAASGCVSDGTSKSNPGTVTKWVTYVSAGVTYYSPLYDSKTS